MSQTRKSMITVMMTMIKKKMMMRTTKSYAKRRHHATVVSSVHIKLLEYNMYCLQYPELSKVYKFLLTILLTQVSCERAFSKLKLIETRLRSSLTNENLESLLLMHSEADTLNSIDPDTVIDYLCHSSSKDFFRFSL